MAKFTTHTLDSVTPEGRETLEKINEKYGFIPNLLGNMIESPAATKAYLALGELMNETRFDAVEQQVVLLAASRFNECEYCVGAHSAIAQMSGIPADVVAAIRNDEPIADPRLETLRRFTSRVIEQHGWLRESQVDEFLAAGFDRQQILEVLLGVAMKTLSNYTNHLAGTELDDAFASHAWHAETPRVA